MSQVIFFFFFFEGFFFYELVIVPEIASEGLKGRVFEVSLGDLNNSEFDFRKFRLICEDVQGRNCLTNFHGMKFTRDKLCSIVKKWHVSSCTLYFDGKNQLLSRRRSSKNVN